MQKTNRGFGIFEFDDCYGNKCSVQRSSATDLEEPPGFTFVWVGIKQPKIQIMAKDAGRNGIETTETTGWIDYPIPDSVLISSRMHLDREQAKVLVEQLQNWIDRKDFNERYGNS